MELVSREQSWLEASKPQSSQAFQANIFRVCGLAVLRLTVATASSSLRDEPLATARFLAILPNFHLKFPRGHPCLRTLRVELPDIRMPIAVITLNNRTLSPIAQLFIDQARGA